MDCAGQAVWEPNIASADTVAVEAIVREYTGFVYRVAYSVLRHHQDAEDATQETFIRVLKHARELSEVRDRKTWLARIAWRIAVDKRRKMPEQSLDEAAEAGCELALSGAGAEQAAIAGNMRALLERMVESLPRDLREVVTLSTVEELSSAAAAQVLGIPEASVRTRLFRARQILKSKLLALEAQRQSRLGQEVTHERG
jgi:RNA polymerase sigma-70 factor (ECF subfamily)